jgi:hypothetical protein
MSQKQQKKLKPKDEDIEKINIKALRTRSLES